jgi:two-component system response regulator (stage 0 sporulation protein F)
LNGPSKRRTASVVDGDSRQEPQPVRVLLAEDDAEMRHLLARSLRDDSFDVTEVSTSIAPLAHLWDGFDLLISDMPGLSGLQILDDGHRATGSPPLILIMAFGSEVTRARAECLGAVAVFSRPFDVDDLLAAVHVAVSDP